MNKIKYIIFAILSVITILIIQVNVKLHTENFNHEEQKEDVILQLNFLESELKNNDLGTKMQQIFPEGFLFINALYGLSWCELAISDSGNDLELKERALSEAIFAYNEIDSDKGKRTFDRSLVPDYGVFYTGWKNYLLSKILAIDTTFQNNEVYIEAFKSRCNNLAQLIVASQNPYVESYYSLAWPADMSVAVASVANHDKVFQAKYASEIEWWLQNVKKRLDPKTGMVPHQVYALTGDAIQGARGCSMVLTLRMLAEINPDFANEQFKRFNEKFVETTFGLPSVREYPKGRYGLGDIDSGPVIFGVGFSATIASIGTFAMFENSIQSSTQYKTINAFGLTRKNNSQKKYLLGKMPIADGFIAWGRATALNSKSSSLKSNSHKWTVKFHLISLALILIIWVLFYRKELRMNIKNIKAK